jgi:4-hydroxybenzoate polyprenyltransferase
MGRSVVIATGADERLAQRVAEHIGGIDHVYATTYGKNLTGSAKAAFLRQNYGDGAFDYIGDSSADLAVWKYCRQAYVVGTESFAERVSRFAHVEQVFPRKRVSVKTWIKALRGHHWAKNLLLFIPLLLAHDVHGLQVAKTFVGFVLFGLCASSIYVINDVLDLHSDRIHPWKSNRPIASGAISIPVGLAVASLLVTFALACAFMSAASFGFVLLGYIVLTMWYSARLKTVVLLDAFVLSSFYTIRVWAGGVVVNVPLSQWFLAFSMFFFLSLAIAKRYSELVHAADLADSNRSGRGYRSEDRELLGVIGVASSFSSIVILALYVQSSQVAALYRHPQVLLLICPILLYWTSRVWLQAYRGELAEDPVTLAMRDRASYFVGALVAAIGVMAL